MQKESNIQCAKVLRSSQQVMLKQLSFDTCHAGVYAGTYVSDEHTKFHCTNDGYFHVDSELT
jgi:hypothetical protein